VPDESAEIRIEIVYAEPFRARRKILCMRAPASVADALRAAASDPDFAGIDLKHAPVGVFGLAARPEQNLKDGDRVEIYRPLAVDPKAARRARAEQARRRR
jgi:putative ubiquitin-RnfH superfamily antitoxin RatB of RatAB toxin-antitoxin module